MFPLFRVGISKREQAADSLPAGPDMPEASRPAREYILASVVYALLLAVVVAKSKLLFSYDAIAYYMLARHWAEGDWALAVSGYWGPLFSWIMAPFLPVSKDPATVARIALAVSSFAFVLAALRLFIVAGLAWPWRGWAIALTMLFAAGWVERVITPDLLMSGLLLLGFGYALQALGGADRRAPWIAGGLYGLAYLAKTPGLPLGIALAVSLPALTWLFGGLAWKDCVRQIGRGLVGVIAVGAVWISVLSIHYGQFTWSTAATLNAAHLEGDEAGSMDVFRALSAPRDGRLSGWEEPSETLGALAAEGRLPPPENGTDGKFEKLAKNLLYLADNFQAMDLFCLMTGLAFLGFFAHPGGTSRFRDEPWRWALLPIALVSLLYLPVWTYPTRYFVIFFPLLMAAAAGQMQRVSAGNGFAWAAGRWPALRRVAMLTAVLVLSGSALIPMMSAYLRLASPIPGRENFLFSGLKLAYPRATAVRACLERNGVRGTVASRFRDHHIASYLALQFGLPFHGTLLEPGDLARERGLLARYGTDLLVVPPDEAWRRAAQAAGLTDLTPMLKSCGLDVSDLTVTIYRLPTPPAGR